MLAMSLVRSRPISEGREPLSERLRCRGQVRSYAAGGLRRGIVRRQLWKRGWSGRSHDIRRWPRLKRPNLGTANRRHQEVG